MERNKFIFYKDWWEALKQMPDDMSRAIIEAIMNYALYGIDTDNPQIAYSIYSLAKGQIDRDTAKYDARAERNRINGSKSKGAPPGNQNARKQPKQPKQPTGLKTTQNNPKQPKQPNNINNNINSNINSNINESAKADNIVDEAEKTKQLNIDFFQRYFAPTKTATLEQLLMQLHRQNPQTKTIEDFKTLAWQTICEWEQNEEPPKEDYTEWSKRLIAQIRIKNRTQNGTTDTNRTANDDQAAAKAKRDEEFAQYIEEKLARGDMPDDVQKWY